MSVGHDKNRLERSLCDFEWHNSENAKTVKIPLRDKYRLKTVMDKHSLLLNVMLRQGMSWYALDKMESETLLPPPLQESEC